jgi:hypothetical protein
MAIRVTRTDKEHTMTLLQQRMIEDMTIRGLAQSTQHAYLRAVQDLADYDKCRPDTFSTRAIQRFIGPLWRQPWVIYAKPPFASAQHVVTYLGCYTHRVALSNDRLVAMREGTVAFRWRDRRQRNRPTVMTLAANEFVRRFLQLCGLPHSCSYVANRTMWRERHK